MCKTLREGAVDQVALQVQHYLVDGCFREFRPNSKVMGIDNNSKDGPFKIVTYVCGQRKYRQVGFSGQKSQNQTSSESSEYLEQISRSLHSRKHQNGGRLLAPFLQQSWERF